MLEHIFVVSNQIKCKKCGDAPFSTHRHDFARCSCGAVAADGGQDYLRRVAKEGHYEDISITAESQECLFLVTKEIEKAMETGRNSWGVTLAALRGIRNAGLKLNHVNNHWSLVVSDIRES